MNLKSRSSASAVGSAVSELSRSGPSNWFCHTSQAEHANSDVLTRPSKIGSIRLTGAALQRRAFATESKLDKFELFSAEEGLTRMDGCSSTGFLVNDVMIEGPVMCFRNAFLCWHVDSLAAVDLSTLSAALLLVPSPDIIVFGTGRTLQPLPQDLAKKLQALRIGFETCSTGNAMATFNILAQEGRHVVGAFLPMNTTV